MVKTMLESMYYILRGVFSVVVGTAIGVVSLAYLGVVWCVGGKENRAFMRQKWASIQKPTVTDYGTYCAVEGAC